MATPDPMDKVKDKEYSNWLKVTLALYYMKSGLHTFIESEIDHLHQSLVQKIYGGQTVPLPPCTTCHASLVKRNKFTGVWEFQKQCSSYCYVWLYELLKLHANPKSEKIYWDNSDVPFWPSKSWECAEVFMPRGQQPTNTEPAECDAQALLTLLANCKHFHPKRSQQGQGLMHTISSMRNKVMHNGEMRVSDADLRNYLQLIIQLLEDHVCLNSIEDCKAAVYNIHKIHNDSVDVFLNVDQEMIALKTAVNEVRQELEMQENNIRYKRTSTKRRPESDGLRQLKSQIEDRCNTVRRLGFIPTKQTEEAKKFLQDKRSIVIQGNPGEGKTTTALLLIDDE